MYQGHRLVFVLWNIRWMNKCLIDCDKPGKKSLFGIANISRASGPQQDVYFKVLCYFSTTCTLCIINILLYMLLWTCLHNPLYTLRSDGLIESLFHSLLTHGISALLTPTHSATVTNLLMWSRDRWGHNMTNHTAVYHGYFWWCDHHCIPDIWHVSDWYLVTFQSHSQLCVN